MRALVGNDTVITQSFYAQDDETLSDATGSLTVTVAKDDGTALAGGTVATNNGSTGLYDFTLTAATHTAELDRLLVTWSGVVDGLTIQKSQIVKVVGDRFFNLAQLRAMKGMSSSSTFTNTELRYARDAAEDFVENYTENAWVAQYKREIFDGDNCNEVFLSRVGTTRLIQVSVNDTVQTLTDWTISRSGRVRTDGDVFTSRPVSENNVEIQYVWGADTIPHDLQHATLRLARHILMSTESSTHDRTRMLQTDWGMAMLDTATEDKPTGIPEVDSVLMRYRYEQPGWIVS